MRVRRPCRALFVLCLGLFGLTALQALPADGAKPTIQVADLQFEAMPSERLVRRAFPVKALAQGVGAELVFLCEVQAQGLLSCHLPRVRQFDGGSDLRTAFERAGQSLIPHYRVAPRLKSGAASAAAVVVLGLQFKVQE